MIDPSAFILFLESNFQFISGVPCSYFKQFLIHLNSLKNKTKLKHVLATREDEAIGIASGVAFSGKQVLVYLQNSGLGNIGDALSSLAQLYKLPMLILVSYRGLESDRDFPEHSIMGEITEPVLKAMKVPYFNLTEDKWEADLNNALKVMEETSSPVALLVKDGVLS
ncbi:MAG: sulfopyruvate decarboxylase subunit alpha [Candidatus Heimdallarchaeota archaeon]